MTLLTVRRTFAAITLCAGLGALYLTYTDSRSTQFAFSTMYASLAVVFAVMAFEERAKSQAPFSIVSFLLSVVNVALAAWSAKIGFLLHS